MNQPGASGTAETRRRGFLDRLIEVRPAGPGRPTFSDKLELFLLALLFVVSIATPDHRPGGAANAPGEAFFNRWIGGTVCMYRRMTGIPCPGCGLSHGFVQLAHGNVGAAVSANPLTPAIFAVLLLRLAADVVLVLRRREVRARISPRIAWKLWGAFFLSLVVLGLWRIVVHVSQG